MESPEPVDDTMESPDTTEHAREPVDEGVCARQCLGAGFVQTEDFVARAQTIMAGTLRLPPHKPWRSKNLADWTADPFSSRNWQFQHHALRWLSSVRFLALEGDSEARTFWLSIVRDWITHNPPENAPSKFSWVDMADGLRAQELVFGWPLAEDEDERSLLLGALSTHGRWLADESHQATGNHALHQNVGLFVVGSFLRRGEWQQVAVDRMESLFLQSFDDAGANDEGSPDYHRMNLSWWRAAWDRVALEGITVPDSVPRTLSRAATFLAHLTRPDGTLVPIGDTHLKRVNSDGWEELEFVASSGTSGEPPRTTVVAAPNGYVLGRSGWGDPQRPFEQHSHYSIRYGNHTSSHQHEDRGSLTFFTGGQDWLTDPGSYMYEPRDPFRKYLRSRNSHNLVTVDDREYVSNHRVWLKAGTTSEIAHDFTVVDSGYENTLITRRVVYLPVLDLLVVMDVVSSDSAVTARQRWHTEPGIKPRYRDSALELQKGDGSRLTVRWLGEASRPKVRYGDDTSTREWVSRKWGQKEPAAGFEVSGNGKTVFFACVFGNSTDDAWSVVSSRAKYESTWLRLSRWGRIWNVTIDDQGVRVNEDENFPASNRHSTTAENATLAIALAGLQQRVGELEQDALLATARAAEANESSTEAMESLAASNHRVKELEQALTEDRENRKRRIASLLALLPEGADPHALLGDLAYQDVVEYIEDPLYLHDLWASGTPQFSLNLGQRRKLARELYKRGYMVRSLHVLKNIATVTGKDQDRDRATVRESELGLMRGDFTPNTRSIDSFEPATGTIMHVVGKALPETQSGYTLRTHYLAEAQAAQGFDVHVFRQVGGTTDASSESRQVVGNTNYHLPDGPVRGSLPWDEWVQINTDALHELVGEVRPSVLHCHSDFLNELLARPVADAYGIPLIYESRGFWEESWLSRTETALGRPLDRDNQHYGWPEAYTLRQEAENRARMASDRVTTLADVMRDHIVASGLAKELVTVTPNGVQPEEFPVVEAKMDLKDSLGIPRDAAVVGYISSIVEYEGIDTLINAFSKLRQLGEDAWLLLVGDGPVRQNLKKTVTALGIQHRVVFTGRVAHESVLDYYSVIDLFVVPRRNRAVCRLVTPLKPFEAFSTGRVVVLSDVDALQEIADQSGAAEVFKADDPDSLADCLRSLLHDEDRRHALAERGAAWTRAQRSWDAIAAKYLSPYEELGVVLFRTLEEDPGQIPSVSSASNRRRHVEVADRREAVSLLQLHGGEGIPTGSENAQKTTTTGWAAYGFEPVALAMPIHWRSSGPEDRSWRMHFHCWEFMHAPLMEWARTGDDHYLMWCVERAISWAEEFSDTADDSTMAWYDMAIAYRTVVLLTLVRAGSLDTEMSTEQYRSLLELVLRQRDAHWKDESFNPRNNHGYYSALSQIVLGREFADLPGMKSLQHQGEQRLRLMTESQFLSDGGHSEHSPDYHRMLLEGFDAALSADLIDDPKVSNIIARAAEALGWMIQPDGCLVQFGDSAQRQMVGKGMTSSSPHTRWILSAGEEGRAPTESMLTLMETGYAFVRHPVVREFEDFGHASYLAFTSAFHSRAHKHCDDNSLVWFENGQQILVDGGRYRYGELLSQDSPLREKGYYYSDPVRQYMETCGAHSTMSVDSDMHDRRRAPHGSGLEHAQKIDDGTYRISGRTPHNLWEHVRDVKFEPAHELVVNDSVSAFDLETHEAFLWWHFDGDLDLRQTESQALILTSDRWPGRALEVNFDVPVDIEILRGSDTPLRGWRSRKDRVKEATWSVCASASFQQKWAVTTSMTFRDFTE